jgi:hypothetical protein
MLLKHLEKRQRVLMFGIFHARRFLISAFDFFVHVLAVA